MQMVPTTGSLSNEVRMMPQPVFRKRVCAQSVQRAWLFALACAEVLLTVVSPPTMAAEILIKPRVTSRGSVVLLGDVAAVTGSPAEATLVDQLLRLELFPAPSRGRTRLLRRQELRELLVLNGVDAALHGFRGAAYTRIDPPLATPSPASEVGRKPADAGHRASAVATRDLPRGAVLEEADLEHRTAPRTTASEAPVAAATGLGSLVGMELLQAVAAGEPIDARKLQRPLLVRRGDLVSVVAQSAGVHVRTTARAMEDAALGDLVTLETLEDRQKYAARVTGRQAAQVYASGIVVSERGRPEQTTPTQAPRRLPAEVKP
jgi:flagella basal body P-ring formation protein FlgA